MKIYKKKNNLTLIEKTKKYLWWICLCVLDFLHLYGLGKKCFDKSLEVTHQKIY
jgi:hypothetical protein